MPIPRMPVGVRAARRVAVALILVAAAGVPALAQNALAQKPITRAEFDRYRLTMANIERMVIIARNLKALENDEDVKRWAAERRAEQVRDESRRSSWGTRTGDGDVEGMNRMVAFMSGQPKLRHAVERSGLTVRDYALTSMALITSGMVVGMEKQYGTKIKNAELRRNLKGAALDNVKLLRANWARVSALSEEMKQYELKQAAEGSGEEAGPGEEEPPTSV